MTPLAAPDIFQPSNDLPVLLSVPHAGRDYPDWLVSLCAKGPRALRTLEDPLVDKLAAPAIRAGFGAVVARAPRAAIDCNRAEGDIDPAVIVGCGVGRPSERARGGLGIVPGRTPQYGQLWKTAITPQQFEDRLNEAHRPYHRALAGLMDQLHGRFGCALLLDCHSMPPLGPDRPQIVIGDGRGRTAATWLADVALEMASEAGLRAARNDPFAGGYVIDAHSDPRWGRHALQLELDRSLYLDRPLSAPSAGFAETADLIRSLALRLGEMLLANGLAVAAE